MGKKIGLGMFLFVTPLIAIGVIEFYPRAKAAVMGMMTPTAPAAE